MNKQKFKNPTRIRGGKRKSRPISNGDVSFFEYDAKRRRKGDAAFKDKEEIESLPSDESEAEVAGGEDQGEEPEETAAETRFRMAREHLERIRAAAKKLEEEEGGGEGDEMNMEEREGRRDSLVAELLQKDQLEASGRIRRLIASRVLKPEPEDGFKVLVKHRLSVTAVGLAEDDIRGFSASKDGTILHWDVESGKHEKYLWPNEDVLISHHARAPQKPTSKRSKNVLTLAVSSDGRYLASGGLDRDIHLWDTRTREHIQAFHGHRGPVSCLTFRLGTPQLFSGSFDRTIKLWNVEDRTHMDNLFGHQSEVLNIDCLHKERLLTVSRDRTMRLWKVPEESQLVFRAPASSLECCCFINDGEFLSGSDDGSIELWSILRKKPTHIIKNAHALSAFHNEHSPIDKNEGLPNGNHAGGSSTLAQSWVSSVAVCRGTDLAASGAANGVVRLWTIASDDKSIQPLFAYPLVGFANSLAFSKSGRFLLAGVGQEPRLGRWGRVHNARNGVSVHPIQLSEEHS
ncbi:U3 snoRNP-associated protein-like YAOH [Phalaenopsis equestris]|uniref:U3 snoRNP-associated protein-like YAOH n=1 Tax=Phalaenopsis equestris TaxID=78828 RepID=UPI0009E350D0|nr:U3 snoRNP-associated protein-like YAOH [Phalaenopsis equestris]